LVRIAVIAFATAVLAAIVGTSNAAAKPIMVLRPSSSVCDQRTTALETTASGRGFPSMMPLRLVLSDPNGQSSQVELGAFKSDARGAFEKHLTLPATACSNGTKFVEVLGTLDQPNGGMIYARAYYDANLVISDTFPSPHKDKLLPAVLVAAGFAFLAAAFAARWKFGKQVAL
jgi:hypothetical protein